MFLVDFSLFLAAVRKVQVSRATIRLAGTGHAGDRHLFLGKAGEQLSSGLERTIVVLLMLGEMIQDGSIDDETLLGVPDFEDERITVSLPPQASHNGSFSQIRSS